MSGVMTLLSAGEAQRLTQRIKLTAGVIRDGLFKLRNLVEEAKNSNAWQVLGYPSWTAYLADALGSEPMRLSREDRQELVEYLSGEGMSTRAIAPIVGAAHKTVARDLAGVSNDTPAESVEGVGNVERSGQEHGQQDAAIPGNDVVTDGLEAVVDRSEEFGEARVVEPHDLHVRGSVGEVVVSDVPPEDLVVVTGSHVGSVAEPRTVTGLDGKTYTSKPARSPKPVLQGDALEKYDAEQNAIAVGRALSTFDAMRTPAHRARVIAWWPAGNDAVPPDSRALFVPTAIRNIASALLELADELEVHS